MPRIEPMAADKELCLQRYERRCAVCATSDALDVAHLHEDATLRQVHSEELIILCPTHNQAQARSHGRSTPILPESFDPGLLLSEAKVEFRSGSRPQSYAKARLAAYIFEVNHCYSEALDCLTEAVSGIRSLRWGDWLAAVFREGSRICVNHGLDVGPGVRWLFLDRMALVLYDYARWDESIDVLLAAKSLAECVKTNPYNPRQTELNRAHAFRREALIRASTGKLDSGQSIQKLLEDLEGIAEEFRQVHQYDSFATTLDVARKIALEVQGNIEKAHRYSERALSEENRIKHKWVLQEHMVSEAGYFFETRNFAEAKQYMFRAMALYSMHPVLLEPVRTTLGPALHDIHEDLARMGIKYETLLENQVAIGPPLIGVRLNLDATTVRQIARSILQ